jgi:ankyrin repeat protein
MDLFNALNKGDIIRAKELVNLEQINMENKYGRTPLHLATIHNDTTIVKFLIVNGADIHVKDGFYGATPLHLATQRGHIDIVKLLIENHANVNETDRNGYSIIEWALKHDYLEIFKYLFEHGVDINKKYKDGKTILHLAFYRLEFVEYLLNNGSDIDAKDNNNNSILNQAYEDNDIILLNFIKRILADNKIKNNYGELRVLAF